MENSAQAIRRDILADAIQTDDITAAGTPVLAFGLGAETCIDGVISKNTEDLDRYRNYSGDYEAITEEVKPL